MAPHFVAIRKIDILIATTGIETSSNYDVRKEKTPNGVRGFYFYKRVYGLFRIFKNMDKVEPYDCWEGVVNGCLDDKDLDNILSILDFPVEGFEGDDGFTGEWDASKSHCLGPIPPDVLTSTGPPVLPPVPTADSDATPEPRHQLSYQPKDTTSRTLTNQFMDAQTIFHTQSPVSVLEGNSGPSSVIKSCTSKRARSRRARPSGPGPWLSLPPPFAAARKPGKARGRRKKSSAVEGDHRETEPPQNGVKRCMHCAVTKTPQWREGPAGPKTLCNACGVRYRSGRLFPEYRPAASPTFVPSMHSNSHRKVIEMRNRAIWQPAGENLGPMPMSPEMEFVPMSSYLFDHLS
ncbi:GATA transcription factor 11 [Striga hermonthica]|uniref:GATA transcription factor 11 n=1 Tax=Striga hermonthica TaxID=68872 RepID=A0A9N7MLA8_STRHE|nr:GATA transcription factor 11 [Striga hermonthica]